MKLYIVSERTNDGQQRFWLYFFLRAALALAGRLTDAEEWTHEKNPSPWRRVDDEGSNIVFWIPGTGRIVEILPVKLSMRDWKFGRWLRKRLSWQNLNEKGRGVTGSILRNGRAWFRPFGYKRGLSLNCEWVLWSKRISCGVGLADYDHALSTHVCLYLFSLYVALEHNRLEHWLRDKIKRTDEKYGNGRTIGFTWLDGLLMFELWNDPMEWRSRDPKWWHFSFNPKRFLMGATDYKSEILETHQAVVTMPEARYQATVTVEKATWTRRRWPFRLFPKIRVDSRIEVPGGVPVPGKGENSWDCGEDAIFSTGSSTPTVAAAVAQITKSALETRERYGGRNWLPARFEKEMSDA